MLCCFFSSSLHHISYIVGRCIYKQHFAFINRVDNKASASAMNMYFSCRIRDDWFFYCVILQASVKCNGIFNTYIYAWIDFQWFKIIDNPAKTISADTLFRFKCVWFYYPIFHFYGKFSLIFSQTTQLYAKQRLRKMKYVKYKLKKLKQEQ